jgi:dTDP-glucose 4,6-dehydratase
MPPRPLPADDLAAVLSLARDSFEALHGARLFITGGTGFFGHWLLESLLHANRELDLNVRATVLTRNAAAFRARAPHIAEDAAISLLEGDVRRFDFPAEPHTHVLHAATESGTQAKSRELADSILEGTRRVLDFALATGAGRLLYVSSGAIYGRNVTEVARIPEDFHGGPDPLASSSSYDESKRMAEQLCVAYAEDTPLTCTIARCFAFLGPHLPLDAHFAAGNFIRDAIAGTPIHLRSDGTPLRSYLYMSDLAAWLWTMLLKGARNRAYNVGSDESVSIAELARLTAATLRPELTIRIDGNPSAGVPAAGYVPAITRAKQELGLRITVPLAEAIRRTAAWHGFPG